jgi:O-antigen ligase
MGFIALFAVAWLSAAFAEKPLIALMGSMDYLKFYAVFAIVASDYADRDSIRLILKIVIAASAIAAVWGIIRYEVGTKMWVELPSGSFTNHSAIYFGLALLYAYHYLFNFVNAGKKAELALAVAGSCIILAALLYSSARSWLSYGRMLFIPFVLLYVERKKLVSTIVLLIVMCLLFVLLFPVNLSNQSYGDRIDVWKTVWEIFSAHPLIGVGAKHMIYYNFPSGHAHNLFLNVLVHQGMAGFSALLLLWFLIFRLVKQTPPKMRPFIISICATYFMISFVNTTLNSQHGFLFAVGIAMAGIGKASDKDQAEI